MSKRSEITLNIEIKTVAYHDNDADVDRMIEVMFDEIRDTSSVSAENWKLRDYKTESLELA